MYKLIHALTFWFRYLHYAVLEDSILAFELLSYICRSYS